ncbi:hypothetical protein LAZ67_13001159 [Cordylochernes scorpioides]|uniref:Reverse transcriptase n=1 Tax=Cordylochernes scorpioides TaxID=51811 RepID=A0ABY6L3L2_9ARAC|nr:hypothetical protein LAZ67_13001159 [Cordylochernes scorpioides]
MVVPSSLGSSVKEAREGTPLLRRETLGRRTKRWPLCLFFNFLDVVAINSAVIYKAVKQDGGMARKDFIKQLALQLMRDALNMRNQAKILSRDLQVLIQKHAGTSSLERKDNFSKCGFHYVPMCPSHRLLVTLLSTPGPSQMCNVPREYVLLSTIDGRLTAMDARDQGKMLWSEKIGESPLLESTLPQFFELEIGGEMYKLLPTFDGKLFINRDGNLQHVGHLTENIMKSIQTQPTGGWERSKYGLDLLTGQLLTLVSVVHAVLLGPKFGPREFLRNQEMENRTSTTLQNRTTSPALERVMVTIAHQDNVLQPTNKLSFISPLQPHHMVESSVGPAPQAANINIGYGETPPCFNPEEEDIEDHVEEFKTWLTASKVPKGDWTKALVRRLPLDGREFIKCRFDPSAALEDVLEALKLCYPRNDGRARSRGNELKKTRRPQSTKDTGRYLMNLITAHATAGEFSPFDSSKEALWALAPKDCLLLAASWSTTRNPEEADFLQAAKFLDEADKLNKERTEAGTTTSWETTTRTAEEWEQKQGRNPRTETPMEKARRFMLPDGTPRCFTCYQTGHKHWDCPKRRPRGKYNFASNPVVEVSNSVESVPRVFSEVTGNTNRIIFRVKGQPGVNEKQTLNKVPIEKSTLEIGGTAMEKFRWTGMTNFCLITHINETHVGKLIFDSGANVSCIDEGIANALGCARMPSKLLIRGISGSVVSNTCTYLEVNIDGFDICGRFTIIPGNGEKIIFGVDILTNYHCKIMFRDESVELYRPKIGRDDHVVELNEERELERLGTITSDRKNPKQKYCILDDLEIAPRCKTRVKLKGPTVMAGILEPNPDCVRRTGLLIPSVHVSETVSEIFIDVINTRNEPVRLVANSCLLRSGGEIANVSFLSEQVGYSTTATCKYEPQKFDINPELSDSEKIDVLDVLYRYRELFSEEWNKAADIEPYHIKLKANTEPIRQKAYRRSPKERDIIEEQVKEMCEKGVIRKSTSPWASPVVLVKKPDGSYRFCVDYRKVNNVTEKFSYPLPDITDCLDRLAGMKYFSHTDFVSGYWQCPLDETSKPITAFTTGNGLYEFQVLPFGLTGAPGHFERIMDTLLAELKWSECMVYLDDVIVYGRDIREHNIRLPKVTNFGHVVSENGVEPATDKIEAVKEFPIPKNVKQVRSFLGLCGYYRRFIKNFSKISKPLTCLTEKDKKFVIGPAEIEAFETLKKKLTEEPILAHFNPDARIEIHTDTSIVGLGAVLMQPDNDGFLHPIHYLSRTTSKHESKYGISELECLAIVWALQKLRPYIFGENSKS